jgi:hypothetical protein
MTAFLNRITIFPIKSLDGLDVPETRVLPSGALEHDRRFALVDAEGRFVNGKRTAAVHRIRTEFDLAIWTVRFNSEIEFSLLHQQHEIGQWLSNALGIACGLAENPSAGFPDDTASPGPTLISTATLAEVATWFPGITLDEARRRFRANLEIGGVEAFWEDRLIGSAGAEIPFQVGGVRWLGMNPCQRCVVPSRAFEGGGTTPGFQKTFASERERRLPAWAPRDRFNHFFHLAVNTRLAPGQPSGRFGVGDPVTGVPRPADS